MLATDDYDLNDGSTSSQMRAWSCARALIVHARTATNATRAPDRARGEARGMAIRSTVLPARVNPSEILLPSRGARGASSPRARRTLRRW